MTCIEFRGALGGGRDELQAEASRHLETCPDCVAWLEESLRGTPDGLRTPAWDEPPLMEFPSAGMKETRAPSVSLWEKWLLAFAIPAFVAFLWVNVPAPVGHAPAQRNSLDSFTFLGDRFDWVSHDVTIAGAPQVGFPQDGDAFCALSQVSFVKNGVTEPEVSPSQDWSFIEKDESYSFLEDEKEESWLQNSAG